MPTTCIRAREEQKISHGIRPDEYYKRARDFNTLKISVGHKMPLKKKMKKKNSLLIDLQ